MSESIDSGKLQEMFRKYGEISSCKVVTSEDGKSKGYGFVQFISEDSANVAIHHLNGTHFNGRQMYVNDTARGFLMILIVKRLIVSFMFIKICW